MTTGRWAPDPYHRFEQRYWSGTEWTDRVSHGDGRIALDPAGSHGIGPPARPLARVEHRALNAPLLIGGTAVVIILVALIAVVGAVNPDPEPVATVAAKATAQRTAESTTTERPPTTTTISTTTTTTTTRPTTTTAPPTTMPPTTVPPTTMPPTTEPPPTVPPTTAPPPTTPPPPPPLPVAPPRSGGCDPNYSGCVPIASDVDCAGGSGNGPAYVSGPVDIIGDDPYDLDANNDGVGCEP